MKGTISGLLGILVSMIGPAPVDTYPRFTFGISSLESGIDTTVALIGIFAIAEIFAMADKEEGDKADTVAVQCFAVPSALLFMAQECAELRIL